MTKYIFKLWCLLCCLTVSSQIEASCRQYLHDGWRFCQARTSIYYPATVPGVVHLDLLANKLIDDPYQEMNERSVQWIDKEDWVYENTFVPESDIFECKNVVLTFGGLDTYADVFLNGKKILAADNMFRRWEVDVKSYLRNGENHLKVYFHSPIKVDLPKWKELPFQYNASNDQSENGGLFGCKLSVFARKAGYHYGWDWGPRLVTSGIWRAVYLTGWNDARIDDVYIRQHQVTSAKAVLTDEVCLESDRSISGVLVSVKEKSTGKVLAKKQCDLMKGKNNISLNFIVKNPRLWWCNGLGRPELYTFTTEVSKGKKTFATKEKRVGLRSVKVVTSPDDKGNMQFYFVLNGQPVFCKGTNYIPQDNFLPRVSRERYETMLHDATAANMNMIRVWGGGIYENDEFYDICDELGLMVWQDFMFACSVYPARGEWLENVRKEAIDNVCRLRNHPSVVLWCGGNECLDAWYNWGWKRKYEQANVEHARRIEDEANQLYFKTLPDVVSAYNPETFYWPSSPFSAKGKGSDGLNGDFHFYGVWQRKLPIDTYNHLKAHFFSEYGVQSFPELNTIHRFAADSTQFDIHSDVMMWHQRGGKKANELIAWYLENEYRTPKNFKEFLYMSQLFQADAIRTAIEAHRRERPYCMGSLLWQHDDCWPVASWSTRDYYGNWKAAHYMVQRAFDNLIVSALADSDSLRVYVVSDLLKKQKGSLTISFYSLDGRKLNRVSVPVMIPAASSTIVWKDEMSNYLKGNDVKDVVVCVELATPNKNCMSNFYLCKQRELRYCPARYDYQVVPVVGGYEVRMKSENFVRALCLSVDGESCHFDDNYFDLVPGIVKKCRVKTSLSEADFVKRLRFQSFN